ncbi:hypothetical protein CEXT_702551 [Caerostris extrusa]|uniref:Uncharacterized protein n=1 Tax=Caerostris extrusa TaxID=172846 RepID=A0AAV4TEC6_CAEEX|nr:hypothetical protein CEXT_702551 [Caerostris extrusa]
MSRTERKQRFCLQSGNVLPDCWRASNHSPLPTFRAIRFLGDGLLCFVARDSVASQPWNTLVSSETATFKLNTFASHVKEI